jgi:hypothetical protein
MAEGYRSAMIASLRGDAPQGPRMGSGVSPLMFDWMRGGNVPLDFQARRAALLRPQRFELPLPLAPTPPSGGGANEPEIPDFTMPPVDVPPSTERGQAVAEKVEEPPVNEPTLEEFLDNLLPPPPPPPPPPPAEVTVEPVNAGDDIFADDYEPAVDESTVEEFLDNLPPPPPPPPPPPAAVIIEPVSAGDDIFADDYEPPVDEPTVEEFLDELPPPPPPPPPPPAAVIIEPVNAGDDIFAEEFQPPVDEPTVEEFLDNLVAGEEPTNQETETTVTPISYEGESFVVGEPVVDPLQDIEDILATAPAAPDYEVSVDEYQDRPLRDYGDDLGTTVIEGAFDPTLGGTYDPGSEIISPIDGPNNVYANPYIGLNAGGSAGFGDTGFVGGPDLSTVGGNVAMPSDVATITQPTTQPALRDQIDQALAAQEAQAAEAARVAEEAQRAEQARLAEEARRAEEARLAEEARRAEEARQAEEARRVEQERLAREQQEREEAQRRAEELALREQIERAMREQEAREAAARAEAERQAQLEEQRQAELAQQEAARRAAEQQAAEQAALEAELTMLAQLEAQTRAAEERQVMRPVKGNRRMLA